MDLLDDYDFPARTIIEKKNPSEVDGKLPPTAYTSTECHGHLAVILRSMEKQSPVGTVGPAAVQSKQRHFSVSPILFLLCFTHDCLATNSGHLAIATYLVLCS